jgi:hypothetical protein
VNDCLVIGCELFATRFNGWALGGAGRVNYWISRDVSVQVDAQAEGTSYDSVGGSGSFSAHSLLVGGHWSWRNPQEYLFGVFGGIGDAGSALGSAASSQRHGLIGAEAQWYWSQFSLYAQGGYDRTIGIPNTFFFGGGNGQNSVADSVGAWFVRGVGRYFVSSNLLIEGTLMYAKGSIDFDPGFSVNGGPSPPLGFQTWSWGVKGEWRAAAAPFSVFASYQGSATTYDTFLSAGGESVDTKLRDHRVLLGLKLHMGDKTLQQTDRAGATLDIVSPLANPSSPLMFGPVLSRN